MDALSIIDRGTQTVVPTKAKNKDDQQFSKALNREQQVHQHPENKSVSQHSDVAEAPQDQKAIGHDSTETPQDQKTVVHNAKTGALQNVDSQRLATIEEADKTIQQAEIVTTAQPQTNVQGTMIALMKTLSQNESVVTKDPDQIEVLLSDLLQQLESTDNQGERVFAGVDLSILTAKLESLENGDNQAEVLAHLVAQIENQLTDQHPLHNGTEVSMAMLESTQQTPTPAIVETLAQARQVLQKAFDAVASQTPMKGENVVAEDNISMSDLPSEETAKELDPRFAGLLKPRTDQPSQPVRSETGLRPLQQGQHPTELKQGEAMPPMTEVAPEAGITQPSGGRQILENFVHQTQHNLQAQGQQQTQGLEINRVMPQTQTVQLASGQQVAESQIFDQVVTHLSGSVNGDTGRMVLRLQPAELGSLRLELKIEGDRVQANLHAQTHQVQEVLERNLPQLRNALAEQGLKIDQFQVNVEQRQQSGQFESLAQQHHNNSSQEQSEWQQQNVETEEQAIPLAHLMQNGGGGISLHV